MLAVDVAALCKRHCAAAIVNEDDEPRSYIYLFANAMQGKGNALLYKCLGCPKLQTNGRKTSDFGDGSVPHPMTNCNGSYQVSILWLQHTKCDLMAIGDILEH